MSAYIVSRDLLEQNIRQLKKQAGDTPIWAVIKGDGYGLGALPLAEDAAENGIEHFCVTQEREQDAFLGEALWCPYESASGRI